MRGFFKGVNILGVTFGFLFCSLFPGFSLAGEGASVKGRIVDEDGNPLVGVLVEFRASSSRKSVKTDGEGKFLVTDLPGTVFTDFGDVRFPGEAHKSFRPGNVPGFMMIEPGEVRDMGDVVYMKYGVVVEGKIHDRSGTPFKSTKFYLTTGTGEFLGAGTTDGEGAFRIKVPAANEGISTYSIRVFRGDSDFPFVFERSGWKPWETVRLDLRTTGTRGKIGGRVTYGGKPLAGASLFLYRKGQKSMVTFFPVVKTGGEGEFVVDGVPEGHYEIHVISDAAPRASFPVRCPSEGEVLDIEKGPLGSVEGYVEIKIEGRPVNEIPEEDEKIGICNAVFLCDLKGEFLRPLEPVAYAKWTGQGWKFSVPNLPEGEYRFQFRNCQKAKGVSAFRSIDDQTVKYRHGYGFLYETYRIVKDPSAKEISKALATRVKAGETSRVEFKKDFTRKEILEKIKEYGG